MKNVASLTVIVRGYRATRSGGGYVWSDKQEVAGHGDRCALPRITVILGSRSDLNRTTVWSAEELRTVAPFS